MEITVTKCLLQEIIDLRKLFLNENSIQFIHNKCHDYGWADEYVFHSDGFRVGYGSVWGLNNRADRDTIFEFYLLPELRNTMTPFIAALVKQTEAGHIECQTNDRMTSAVFFDIAKNIQVQSMLFEDRFLSKLNKDGLTFVNQSSPDNSGHELKYALLEDGVEVATGGLLLNYNFPYADVYMEVVENLRGRGLGALMVQELKAAAYRNGRIPAARCNVNNKISEATLLKAGFALCGYLMIGDIT